MPPVALHLSEPHCVFQGLRGLVASSPAAGACIPAPERWPRCRPGQRAVNIAGHAHYVVWTGAPKAPPLQEACQRGKEVVGSGQGLPVHLDSPCEYEAGLLQPPLLVSLVGIWV